MLHPIPAFARAPIGVLQQLAEVTLKYTIDGATGKTTQGCESTGPRTRQLSGQWDSWTAGQLGTDRRGTAAAATQPKHHSPATGRVLRPWVVAWAVQMQ